MHDGMQYDLIQGQGHEPFRVGNPAIFKSYLFRHLQWEQATDHGFLNWGTISKFCRAKFLISGPVFVSRDFELGTNVSCEESTVSLRTRLMYIRPVHSDPSLFSPTCFRQPRDPHPVTWNVAPADVLFSSAVLGMI